MLNKTVLLLLLAFKLVHSAEEGEAPTFEPLTNAQIWGFGVLAGVGISCIGFFAACALVVIRKCLSPQCFEIILKLMFSLSCGALLGDAIIHIIAESYQNEQTNKLVVSAILILSILFFLVVDRLLHSLGIAHSHWVGEKCQGEKQNHGHHHHSIENNIKVQPLNPQQGHHQNNQQVNGIDSSPDLRTDQQEVKNKSCCQNLKGKDSAGYMNIFGSAIHNFFDGLALGIAFATGNPTQIIPVVVAIVAHEIPRQLGDVAILLKSQFTGAQTILCNGFVNFLSLIGVFIGLAVVNVNEAVKIYILIFVAGNFIYIASDIWQHIFKNKGEGSKFRNAMQFIGIGIGLGAMFALTLLQKKKDN